MATISITFCDQGENHAGMQKIGHLSETGYSESDMLRMKQSFESIECAKVEYYRLDNLVTDCNEAPYASLLIVRDVISIFSKIYPHSSDHQTLFDESKALVWDQQAKMYGRVVNKHARYNLCIAELDEDQEPDYLLGKGRIYRWRNPLISNLSQFHQNLIRFINDESIKVAEMNYYYDVTKCGIGYHGDSERKRVICLRLGETMPLKYRWYKNNKPTEFEKQFTINGGDLYIMSEKSVGFDFKKKSIPLTLRHAAGCEKFL